VLIVDDEPFNLIALEGLLNMKGITDIHKAFNGVEAIEMVNRSLIVPVMDGPNLSCEPFVTSPLTERGDNQFNLIILDNTMPFMTGMDCARKLREMQEVGILSPSVKIIMISGDDFNRK
jgi:CheY-like chemotaxis protein